MKILSTADNNMVWFDTEGGEMEKFVDPHIF